MSMLGELLVSSIVVFGLLLFTYGLIFLCTLFFDWLAGRKRD